MWILYILYSANRDRFYTGYTGDDFIERLRRHNSDHKGFTGGVGDWKIVYKKEYELKNEASRKEKEIKNWKSRKMIEKLIRADHPD